MERSRALLRGMRRDARLFFSADARIFGWPLSDTGGREKQGLTGVCAIYIIELYK